MGSPGHPKNPHLPQTALAAFEVCFPAREFENAGCLKRMQEEVKAKRQRSDNIDYGKLGVPGGVLSWQASYSLNNICCLFV